MRDATARARLVTGPVTVQLWAPSFSTLANSVGITTAVRNSAGTPPSLRSSFGRMRGGRNATMSWFMTLTAMSLAGISPRTLSLRLRALEEQGIVERHTFPEVPPRVEYSLTPKGMAIVPLIEDMRRYGREWLGVDDCATTPGAGRQPGGRPVPPAVVGGAEVGAALHDLARRREPRLGVIHAGLAGRAPAEADLQLWLRSHRLQHCAITRDVLAAPLTRIQPRSELLLKIEERI